MPDHLQSKWSDRPEWFDDSTFWERFAPIMFDDAHWKEVPEAAYSVIELAELTIPSEKLPVPSKILDMQCGFGRISAELARYGFSVTGVDITDSYLKAAKEDAEYENLNIEYIKSDSRNFTRPNYFDTAVILYNSFGFFSDQNDDKLVICNLFESLKNNGTIIIENLGKEIAVRDYVENDWFERAGYKVLTEYQILDSWEYLKNRWILVKDGEEYEKTFIQRMYSATELKSLLLETGFKNIEIYGDWYKNAYDHNAEKLIVVGRKI